MVSIRALREAFDELNAHQACLLPAMQQALLGVLERFGADARLRAQTAEDSRAQLWQHCLRARVEAGVRLTPPGP